MDIDLAAAASAMGSLKAASDILKTGKDIFGASPKISEKLIELSSALSAAQASNATSYATQIALVRRVEELEAQIVQMKSWDAEKLNYVLKAIGGGAFVYANKPSVENGEPAHWLCPNCFSVGHKSFLQNFGNVGPRGERRDKSQWKCARCKSELYIHYSYNPTNPGT